MFEGMDNSQPLNYTTLKKQTFKDIFNTSNRDASSLKRCLNYLNYSKIDYDVINKQQKNDIYDDFDTQICQYDIPKPPQFDLQLNLKMAKKREKATLDKQSKKFIVKNIRTCSNFATTQRDKLRLSILKKSGGKLLPKKSMTIAVDENDKTSLPYNVEYNNFLDERTPSNLKFRGPNRRVKSQIKHNLSNTSPMRVSEPLAINETVINSRFRRKQSIESQQDVPDNRLVFLQRKIKSQNGTRRLKRFNENEIIDTTKEQNQTRPQSSAEKHNQSHSRFKTLQANDNYNTEQDQLVLTRFNLKTIGGQADQMKKRSLSSYCSKRSTHRKQQYKAQQQADLTNSTLKERVMQAQKGQEMDEVKQKRLQNLERFIDKNKSKIGQEQVLSYALDFLDRVAQTNVDDDSKGIGNGMTLGDYQWNSKVQRNTKIGQNNQQNTNEDFGKAIENLNLEEQTIQIDRILEQNNNDAQQGEFKEQKTQLFVNTEKMNAIETELKEEKQKRKTGASKQSSTQVNQYMNKAKGGGYSKVAQVKNEAKEREILEQLEKEKIKERQIMNERKQFQKEREKRIAEERMKKVQEEQNKLQKKKDQQKEFYVKFLRKTAEQNLEKVQNQKVNYVALPQLVQKRGEQSNTQALIVEEKFQTKIPCPKFAQDLPMQRRHFQQNGATIDKDKQNKLINNLDALDLELSQSKRHFQLSFKPKDGSSPKQVKKLLERGDLIDSLDLNIGYESIQKLKGDWFGGQSKLQNKVQQNQVKKVVPNQKINQQEPEFDRDDEEIKGSDLQYSDSQSSQDKEFNQDEMQILNNVKQDKNWLQKSIRQSVCDWKQMLNKNQENVSHNIVNGQQPGTWIDQEYSKGQAIHKVVEEPKQIIQKPIIQQKVNNNPKEQNDELTFGQKLEAQQKEIAKQVQIQTNIQPGMNNQRPPRFDDTKSAVSKVSKSSSKLGAKVIQHQSSQSNILSKEEEHKKAQDKKAQLDGIKKKYTQVSRQRSKRRDGSQNRNNSPSGTTTKCTRDEDINIEEFMKDDLRSINKEEEKLQREIVNLHKQNLHKHHQVVTKHHIDTNIKNTEELVRKMVNAPQIQPQQNEKGKQNNLMRPGVIDAQEEQIQESLDNLDMLLQNVRSNDTKKKEAEIQRLGQKFNIDLNNDDDQIKQYGKVKKVVQDYKQPFQIPAQNIPNQQQQIYNIEPKQQSAVNNMNQNNQKYVEKQNLNSQRQASQKQIPSQQLQQQQQQCQQPSQQQQPQALFQNNNVFQPFANQALVQNLYNQEQIQQKLSQMIQYQNQMISAQTQLQQQANFQQQDNYSYEIGGAKPQNIQEASILTQNNPQIIRSNKDLLRMKNQQYKNHPPGERDGEDTIDFKQYDIDEIEDSLNDNQANKQIIPQQQKNYPQQNVQRVPQNNQIQQNQVVKQKPIAEQQPNNGDKVKINPRFNMKILFDDED